MKKIKIKLFEKLNFKTFIYFIYFINDKNTNYSNLKIKIIFKILIFFKNFEMS